MGCENITDVGLTALADGCEGLRKITLAGCENTTDKGKALIVDHIRSVRNNPTESDTGSDMESSSSDHSDDDAVVVPPPTSSSSDPQSPSSSGPSSGGTRRRKKRTTRKKQSPKPRKPRGDAELISASRPGQAEFQNRVLELFNGRCVLTDLSYDCAGGAVQAAHVIPYSECADGDPIKMDPLQNGLLLRADLHFLWDADDLTISPDPESSPDSDAQPDEKRLKVKLEWSSEELADSYAIPDVVEITGSRDWKVEDFVDLLNRRNNL